MEILVKHCLETAVLAVQQHILPMCVIIRFLGVVLVSSQVHNGCGFRGVEVIDKHLCQGCRISHIAAVGTIDTHRRRSQYHIRQRDDQILRHTDEGISALNTKKREGFNRMIADALAGKIDLIVTKSVSRFARNTVDSLTTVRQLEEKGIEVYFEKENIWTLDSKGELLITIMSSLAQEESRSISENVTWGQRKRFADGKVSLPYGQFLGYRKGDDGLPEIIPDVSGGTIHQRYCQATDAARYSHIRRFDMRQTIESILQNEKHKGSALLQKKYTVDFLQKKMKRNEGEVPQYYVEHSHPAIIDPEEWEKVQLELARRKSSGKIPIAIVRSLSNWSVEIAESVSDQRFGIPTANTAVPSGSAMPSSRVMKSDIPRIYMRMISKITL